MFFSLRQINGYIIVYKTQHLQYPNRAICIKFAREIFGNNMSLNVDVSKSKILDKDCKISANAGFEQRTYEPSPGLKYIM